MVEAPGGIIENTRFVSLGSMARPGLSSCLHALAPIGANYLLLPQIPNGA